MNSVRNSLVIVLLSVLNFHCVSQKIGFKPKVVFKTQDFVITQITEKSFQHTSFLKTNDFGNVPCNGLVVTNKNEAIVFDTPTNNESSKSLITWIKEVLHCKVNAIIPTHFHDDCLGGLKVFHDNNIPSYAYFRTIEFAKEHNFIIPENGFSDSLILKVGDENTVTKFFGEGHTRDNIVGYFPNEDLMFGGCLLKEMGAGKGYLGDANVKDWSNTVEKVKQAYPNVKIVVPGHGKYGNKDLLDYTIKLFRTR